MRRNRQQLRKVHDFLSIAGAFYDHYMFMSRDYQNPSFTFSQFFSAAIILLQDFLRKKNIFFLISSILRN